MYQVMHYKNSRFFCIVAPDGALVAVTVYKKGAQRVADLLNQAINQNN